jgi:hypothetical protein
MQSQTALTLSMTRTPVSEKAPMGRVLRADVAGDPKSNLRIFLTAE